MTRYLTIQQAAETLSVSEDTIRRMLPRLGATDLMGGRGKKRMVRIPEDRLTAYLHDNMILSRVEVETRAMARKTTGYKLERRRA